MIWLWNGKGAEKIPKLERNSDVEVMSQMGSREWDRQMSYENECRSRDFCSREAANNRRQLEFVK